MGVSPTGKQAINMKVFFYYRSFDSNDGIVNKVYS